MSQPVHRRLCALALCLAGIAVAGAIDHLTGYEVRTYPLYFIPISFAAWRLSRTSVILLAALSATVGGAANLTSGAIYSAQYVWFFNWLSQLSAFSLVGVLMSELHRRLQIERSLSRQDTVTGLANTRGFYEQASLLLTVAKRTSVPVTLAYLDLDNFKAVNDRHGHEAGDRALSEAATVLRRHARASDVVARLGGDEFAILLLDAGPEAARTMLERIRSLLSEAMKNRAWPITVSIGASSYLRAPAVLEEAVRGADALMYRAKAGGKDRVHVEVAG